MLEWRKRHSHPLSLEEHLSDDRKPGKGKCCCCCRHSWVCSQCQCWVCSWVPCASPSRDLASPPGTRSWLALTEITIVVDFINRVSEVLKARRVSRGYLGWTAWMPHAHWYGVPSLSCMLVCFLAFGAVFWAPREIPGSSSLTCHPSPFLSLLLSEPGPSPRSDSQLLSAALCGMRKNRDGMWFYLQLLHFFLCLHFDNFQSTSVCRSSSALAWLPHKELQCLCPSLTLFLSACVCWAQPDVVPYDLIHPMHEDDWK